MSRLSCVIILCLCCLACKPDASQDSNEVNTATAQSASLNNQQETNRPKQKPKGPKAVDGQTVPTTSQEFLLTALNVEATTGTEICVPIQANGFKELLAMQYTLQWDASKLKYNKVMVGKFPQFTAKNINEQLADKGLMPVVWIDDNLQGITLEEGVLLYQICFQVTGRSGQQAEIGFTNKPTTFEVINKQEQVLVFRHQTGKVRIN